MPYKDPEKRRECYRRWYSDNLEKARKSGRKKATEYNQRIRLKAYHIIGGPHLVCSRCGCERADLLTINHINCDGGQENENRSGTKFYRKIVQGKRKTDDLEILCKLCNWAHYYETKYGIKYKIILDVYSASRKG